MAAAVLLAAGQQPASDGESKDRMMCSCYVIFLGYGDVELVIFLCVQHRRLGAGSGLSTAPELATTAHAGSVQFG